MTLKRSEIAEKYKWNLKAIYDNEELWNNDLDLVSSIDLTNYQGKLNTVESILELFIKTEEIERKLSKAYVYASLKYSEDLSNSSSNQLLNKVQKVYVNYAQKYAFVEPEIIALNEDLLQGIISDERLISYRYKLERLQASKKHILSAQEEALLSNLGEVLGSGGNTSSKLLDVDLIYEDALDSKGNLHQVTGANYILLQESKDRVLRENAFKSKYKSFKQHINTFASTYENAVKTANKLAEIRGFKSSRNAKLFFDDIDEKVYDNLIEVVHQNLDKLQRYERIRKKILKIDDLHYYDLYAPLSQEVEEKYPFELAKDLVIDSVAPLGKEYQDVVKSAFKDGWIDVYPSAGKRSGAFSSGCFDTYPYILLNHVDTLDSVSTLAHEMGHSMHSYLTRNNQPSHYENYTMFVAEVASTVNETLLVEQLLSKTQDPKTKLALLNLYLEGFKGTVYRQTLFAEFELKVHQFEQEGNALTPDALNEIYADLIKKYYGEELVFDEEIKYEWARIPHFYRPFYVYVYATGYTSAISIASDILNNKENAVENYLSFLKTGSSMPPVEELKLAGVDLTTTTSIQKALDKFNEVLDEVEKLIQ